MGLRANVIPVNEISREQHEAMLGLMQAHYLNVDAQRFRADLEEKDKVIILQDAGAIRGFSTWMLAPFETGGRTVNVIFSGDTIVEKESRCSMVLPIAWGRMMLSALEQHPERELYWLLTSKGYKTYRFLPVFFLEFYPSFVRDTPAFERALIQGFATGKFGRRFSPATGVVAAPDDGQKLVPGTADVTDHRRKDPHIAFFEKMNPGYALGNELVCLARCRKDNINRFILRHLER